MTQHFIGPVYALPDPCCWLTASDILWYALITSYIAPSMTRWVHTHTLLDLIWLVIPDIIELNQYLITSSLLIIALLPERHRVTKSTHPPGDWKESLWFDKHRGEAIWVQDFSPPPLLGRCGCNCWATSHESISTSQHAWGAEKNATPCQWWRWLVTVFVGDVRP